MSDTGGLGIIGEETPEREREAGCPDLQRRQLPQHAARSTTGLVVVVVGVSPGMARSGMGTSGMGWSGMPKSTQVVTWAMALSSPSTAAVIDARASRR